MLDGRSLALGYANELERARIDVLDSNTLAVRFSPDVSGVTNGVLASVAWSRDGRDLYAAGSWELERVIVRHWPEGGQGKPVDIAAASRRKVSALSALPGGGVLVSGADFRGVIDARNAWHPHSTSPLAQLRNKQTDVWGDPIQDYRGYALSQDAGRVQFAFERDGASPYVFDVRRRELKSGTAGDLLPPKVTGVNIERWSSDFQHPDFDGQPLALDPNERSLALAVSPDAQRFALGTFWKVRLYERTGKLIWEHPAPDAAFGVNIAANGKTMVAFYDDGTIRWYRITDGTELLALFPHGDRKRWAALDSLGVLRRLGGRRGSHRVAREPRHRSGSGFLSRSALPREIPRPMSSIGCSTRSTSARLCARRTPRLAVGRICSPPSHGFCRRSWTS